jgi:Tol biopolymer transport system component
MENAPRRARRARVALGTSLAILALAGIPGPVAADTSVNGRIAFASNADGNADEDYDIYTMEPDGSNIVQLTGTSSSEVAYDSQPRWSPDGNQIAFVSNREGNDTEIYVMSADGSNVRRVTRDNFGAYGPSWSPGGSQIVFGGNDPVEEHYDYDIYVVDADGATPAVNLTEPNETESLQWQEFSPDWSWVHNRIAFEAVRYLEDVQFPGGYLKIVTVRPDGSDERIVSALNDDHDHHPRWSPDGNWIAFGTEPQPEQGWDVQVVHPDGTGQLNPTNTYFTQELYPSWSADGTRLLFTANTSEDLYSIYTADFRQAPFTDSAAAADVPMGATVPAAPESVTAQATTAPPRTRVTRIGGVAESDWQGQPGLEACTIRGTSGANTLRGTAGPDVICGLGGADILYGLGGNDVLIGGGGPDKLYGGAGADLLVGEAAIDELRGGKGRDTLQGGAENDLLLGGAGRDACSEGTIVGNEAGCD